MYTDQKQRTFLEIKQKFEIHFPLFFFAFERKMLSLYFIGCRSVCKMLLQSDNKL